MQKSMTKLHSLKSKRQLLTQTQQLNDSNLTRVVGQLPPNVYVGDVGLAVEQGERHGSAGSFRVSSQAPNGHAI
jgi:hypothetical protein